MSIALPGFTPAELEVRGAAWTAREIAQQPGVWLDVADQVAGRRTHLDRFLAPLLSNPAGRVILSGAGTSAFVGECLVPALSPRLMQRVDSIATTDIVSGPGMRLHQDVPTLLVSFARSGNSPESVATVDLAERMLRNVHHLVITCNDDGELARRARTLRSAELLLLPEVTNDRGFAMTSSFTSMLLGAGLAFDAIRSEAVGSLSRAAASALPRVWLLAERLVQHEFQRVVYLGSNELRGLASEAALKLLELTDGQTVAMADSTLGFRHGPKTFINDRTLVVLMLSNHPHARAYDLDLLEELRRDARAGAIVALSGREDGQKPAEHLVFNGMSEVADLELSLLHILAAQCYALLQSLSLGLSPDTPNAAGIVNRVVQGVTIYPWSGKDVPGR